MLLAENEFPLFESTSAATIAYIYLIYPYYIHILSMV